MILEVSSAKSIAFLHQKSEMANDEMGVTSEDVVWYFGYGSNMKSTTMMSRGIRPLDTKVVKVRSYVLTFDVFGLAYSEPSMASIARYVRTSPLSAKHDDDPPDVHGVAFLITFSDLTKLIASEGGGVAYNEVMLDGVVVEDGAIISMYALEAKFPRRPNAAPSARYLVRLRKDTIETH